MKRDRFIRLCLLICAMACAGTAFAKSQTTSSSKSASTHSSSSAKRTTKRRRTSRKFVPKQKVPTAERITEIQSALARGGYYQGEPNGKWDSSTVAAMQKFQSANGIEATGKIDAPSLQKLGLGSDVAGVSAPKPIIPSDTSAPSAPPVPAPAGDQQASPTAATPATAAALAVPPGSTGSKTPQQ